MVKTHTFTLVMFSALLHLLFSLLRMEFILFKCLHSTHPPHATYLQVVQAAQSARCIGCECEPQRLHHLGQVLVGLCGVKHGGGICIGIGGCGVEPPCSAAAIANIAWAVGAWDTHHIGQRAGVGELVIPGDGEICI